MENLNTKRKVRTVLTASFFGAVLFALIAFANSWARDSYDHSEVHGWLPDLFIGLFQFAAFFLDMLTVFVLTSFGFHDFSPNSIYMQNVVNALNGAVIFALIALLWQFIVKRDRENN